MPQNPSSDNYTLGRGRVIWNNRDLGNVPAFTMNITLEKLKHYTSRSGLKSLDKTIITMVTPMAKFTIDEMSVENIEMAMLGTTTKVVQGAADIVGQIAAAALNTQYLCTNTSDSLRKFDVGVWKISHGTVTNGPFVVGDTITGGTSLATGDIIKVGATYVYVNNIAISTFDSGETITGTTTEVATTTTPQTWTADLAVDVAGSYHDLTTDYTIDEKSGRIKIVNGGGISALDVVDWEGSCLAKTHSKVTGLSSTSLNGSLTFVPDVPEGTNIELNFHSVDLTPTGDLSLIGDEIMTLEFEAEILKDETNHPLSPYMDGYIDDYV